MRTWCFACVVVAWWGVAAGGCDVTIGDRRYTEEMLVGDVPAPIGLAVDFHTQYLYFSFYNGFYGTERRYNGKVDVKGKGFSVIKELRGACAFAVDQARGAVHAGCRTAYGGPGGLYTWDSNTGRFELAGEPGRDVRVVHYHNDTLYYTAHPEYLLHSFTRGHSARLPAPASEVWDVVVDAKGQFIFTNYTGVYRLRGSGEEVRYAEVDDWVWALAVDGRGAAYACDTGLRRGVWRLPDRPPATKLLDVGCGSLTFDRDGNLIYGDWSRRSIVRLVPC